MACSVCAGYSSHDCPCCGTPRMVECPEGCDEGLIYYAFDTRTRKMTRVTELAYHILPDDEDEAKALRLKNCKGAVLDCPRCQGEGEVPEY